MEDVTVAHVQEEFLPQLKAQEGSQEAFLRSNAHITVYGGAVGAGKSFALLMEPLYHISNPAFGAVIFRRTYPQIMNEGGLWDTSMKIYPFVGGKAKPSKLEWTFPSGAKVKFAHMQHEKDRLQWDGAQIPLLCWDQLEHFTWRQFFYMLARNRTTCGVRPYIRATCNPQVDHWLRDFMSWWINEETGLPYYERSGILRWFVIREDQPIWGDTRAELVERFGKGSLPKSFTFIPGTVKDNPILMNSNPDYLSNLQALSRIDRERLLHGNWNIREEAGEFFQSAWFEIVPVAPSGIQAMRYWDRAATATEPGKENKASWTAGVLLVKTAQGMYCIKDIVRFQGTPLTVEERIQAVASQDGTSVEIGIEVDPGQAGIAEAGRYPRLLPNHVVRLNKVHESKGIRAKPVSAQAEAGNIKLAQGRWNTAFLKEAENFDGSHTCTSDQIDGLSGAYFLLNNHKPAGIWGKR